MIVTELQRAGDGTLVDTPVVFRWSSAEHSSSIGDLPLHLMVKSVRREIPGSNGAVVEHAMSATWQPFDIQGEWDDKWGNRRFPANGTLTRTGSYAFTMFIEFSKLVSRMSLVRVEVDALSFIGLLTDLKIRYRTQTTIGWVVTLSPHTNETVVVEKGKSIVQQSLPKWVEDASDIQDGILIAMDSITASSGTLEPLSFKTPALDGFTKQLLEINDSIDRMQGIVEDGFHTETEAKLLLMASTFRRVRTASITSFDYIKNSVPSDDLGFTDALQEMRYKEWRCGAVEEFWKMVALSRDAEYDIRRRVKQKPRAIYYPKKHESLERISVKFYGTADNWRAIYDKNNLSSIVLDGTEELVIPERAT